MPVVLPGEERGHRRGASVHEHLRVVLHGHDEERLIAGGIQSALHGDVIRAEDVHRHDLVEHKVVAPAGRVVVRVILDGNGNWLVGQDHRARWVRGGIEVGGGNGVSTGIGLPPVQGDREGGQGRMAIHRHGRIDEHRGVVLRGHDIERGERQIGVVRREVVVVEGRMLVQRYVELGAKAVGALQRHDVRVVRVAALVVAGDVGRGLDQQAGVAHRIGGARLQLGLQRGHVVAHGRIGRHVQHDRAASIEGRIGRLRHGDRGRRIARGDIQEDRLVPRHVMPQGHVRRGHPELGSRLCMEQPGQEHPKHPEQCLFHSIRSAHEWWAGRLYGRRTTWFDSSMNHAVSPTPPWRFSKHQHIHIVLFIRYLMALILPS